MVVGGANLDVKARSSAALVPGTSNPGRTRISPGGVGRNIAENLARLDTPTRLVTAVGTDPAGDQLLAATETSGVDVSLVHRDPEQPTGSYTALLDADAELTGAVADMAATDALTPETLPAAAIREAALLVLDGNLQPATFIRASELAAASAVPVVADPVSVPKARRLRASLTGPLHVITPNRDELLALTGEDVPDAATRALHALGIDLVWVRLGADGSLLSGPDGTTHPAPVAADVVDVTGAGDAMLAAFCHAMLAGAAPAEAASYGHAAAALTIASDHTVRPDLTDDLVRSLL